MRRRLQKLGVFLLLGAIVNVVVAWGSAVWVDVKFVSTSERGRRIEGPSHLTKNCWYVIRQDAVSGTLIYRRYCERDTEFSSAYTINHGVPRWSGAAVVPSVNEQWNVYIEEARGWPLKCLLWTQSFLRTERPDLLADNATRIYTGALRLQWQPILKREIVLPYGFIWPGFAINTIFYTAILWLLWIAPGRIRRFIIIRRRIRHHRCPACGYQIAEGVGPRCSECGHALANVAPDR